MTKLELIDKMQEDLSIYPGIDFNFSQPITDNVEGVSQCAEGIERAGCHLCGF